MGYPGFEAELHGTTLFGERRKLRRVRMIVDLTSALISRDASISYREARCLIDCAEKAIFELLPNYQLNFERHIRPTFDRILRDRWPVETSAPLRSGREHGELVN